MATSTKMVVEPSAGWMNVDGMSLDTEPTPIYQSSSQIYDYRNKQVQSPTHSITPTLTSQAKSSIPYHITIIDGPFQHAKRHQEQQQQQQQKYESSDTSKKLSTDRHMRKSKSLPGLIKGSTVARQQGLQSVSFLMPSPPHPSANNSQDDLLASMRNENQDDSILVPVDPVDTTHDIRRPKVYFADFNNIQFIEDKKDLQQQRLAAAAAIYRRTRHHRSSRKSFSSIQQVSPPSIQQPQTLENLSRSGSRQQGILAPRTQPLHITHLPDILNSSFPTHEHSYSRPAFHRDRFSQRSKKINGESSGNASVDASRDPTRLSRVHSSSTRDSNLQPTNQSVVSDVEHGLPMGRRTSLASSSTQARQRSSHRTVSLRQQYLSPFRSDSNQTSQQSHYLNSTSNHSRRSASYRTPNVHFQQDDILPDQRSLGRTESAKQIKRSHIIHITAKPSSMNNSFNADFNDNTRSASKTKKPKNSQERFHNLLTIVRPPYANGHHASTTSITDAIVAPTNTTPSTGRRSVRRTSAQGPLEFHITTNTIVV